jgi:hypothetical protein
VAAIKPNHLIPGLTKEDAVMTALSSPMILSQGLADAVPAHLLLALSGLAERHWVWRVRVPQVRVLQARLQQVQGLPVPEPLVPPEVCKCYFHSISTIPFLTRYAQKMHSWQANVVPQDSGLF